METNEVGFDDWDAEFMEQLIQVEEQALTASTQNPAKPPVPQYMINVTTASAAVTATNAPSTSSGLYYSPPPPRQKPRSAFCGASISANECSDNYSPPRELSQRMPIPNNRLDQSVYAREPEIERLKKELGRVSKQLTSLENECLELRKERDKKDEQLKSTFLKPDCRESTVLVQDYPAVSLQCENACYDKRPASCVKITQKSIGLQTDKEQECTISGSKGSPTTYADLQTRLWLIWSPLTIHGSRKNILIAKLFETCASDLFSLLDGVGLNVSSKTKDFSEMEPSTNMSLLDNVQYLHSVQAATLAKLCSVLAKISDGAFQVDVLVEVLLELCNLENVLVVHRSLRVLHAVLDHLLVMERKLFKREIVKTEGLHSRKQSDKFYGSEKPGFGGETVISNAEELECKYDWGQSAALSVCHVDWVRLYESMCQIAMKSIKEDVRKEAVSIMNAIVMGSNAYAERAKFGGKLVFDAAAQLLRKEAGLSVQKEAVHLLFLLLNCPKLLAVFCLDNNDECSRSANNEAQIIDSQVTIMILEGLADCLGCCKYGVHGLNLCRDAVVALAFLSSSGKSGIEILFSKLSDGANLLGLIMQVLVSEIDEEASESCAALEITKERTLFMREALILLNRLVSHPTYSTTVLQELTSCRDMANLAIDIASRLPRKSKRLWGVDNITRQMRESEVVDLARVFQKRVYTFLGEPVPT